MSSNSASVRSATARQFGGFLVVGGAGFAVDAGILTLLVNVLDWHHYAARLLSFSAAVTLTWSLNRIYVFGKTADASSEYARYIVIQCVGAAINLGAYVGIIEWRPALASLPVVPLAVGAALSMLFTFFASRRFAFGAAPAIAARPVPGRHSGSYSGRENLEAMKHARNYNDFLVRTVERFAQPGTIVDFGAGAGTFAVPLARSGRRIVCVEPDDDLRLGLRAQGFEVHADIAAIAPGSVDYIYSLNVLEHIEDDRAMLEYLGSRLKPGGALLIYVPAFEILYSSMDALVGHFRRYRRKQLTELAARAGLEIRHASYVDCLGFLAALIYRALGSSGTINSASVRIYDRIAFPVSLIADRLCSRILGKNLLVVAGKPR